MAFVDFLEPSQPLPTNPKHSPLSSAAGGGAGAFNRRLNFRGTSNDSPNGGFDLRKVVAAKAAPIRDDGRPPPSPTSDCAAQDSKNKGRRMSFNGGKTLLSFGRSNTNNSSTSASAKPVFGGLDECSSPGSNASNASSPTCASPQSAFAPSPKATPPPGHARGLDMKLQATFERSMNGSVRSGISMNDTTTSSNDETGSKLDLFRVSAPEDMANDAALGAFLAATNAATRARRQRAAEEILPRSQQLLNQQVTRRTRRMSSDASVCETRPWVDALQGADVRAKREAAKNIRTALKDGPENRMRLVGSGGVRPLVLALTCPDNETAEHAAAAILFLAMSRDTSAEVISSGGVKVLIEAVGVEDPLRESARSNAAASLFALSQKDDTRKLVHSQGAIKPLVALLISAKTTRAKKDACLALFNMALAPHGPEEMVELGVVERTVELLEEAEDGVEEKAAALLGGLAKDEAGLKAIQADEDVLYALSDTLEGGSKAAAEHACVTLYQLAAKYPKNVPKILAEGCLPPLVRVASESKKGSDARLLLDILRAYCKKKAKEQEMEMKKQPLVRQPSRLGSSSFSEGPGQPSLIDRDLLLKQWSGEATPSAM